jgi:acyl-CoA synthetase (NDP forming)
MKRHEPAGRLMRLLRPRHIATFGGRAAERVISQCQKAGFQGEIWPVHPERERLGGVPAYPSVAALPSPPDASFVGVNRHASVSVVGELAAAGAGGAVCYASGFAEADTAGALLQQALAEAAGQMPLLGPNCYGFINYLDGALLWPDQHGGRRAERGVALITQSSNIALNLSMNRRGLPLAYVLTVGNQATLGIAELIDGLADDARVSVVGLHVEGLQDAPGFAAAVQRARAVGKPIVAMVMGRSEAGRALALTHTASLAGAAAVLAAFLNRLGIAQVGSLSALLEALKLLHVIGPLPGRDVVSLSCSGGEAGLVADAALATRLRLRPFDDADRARILPTLNPLVTLSNPFDYHTFDWANGSRLETTFRKVLESRFDLALLMLDMPRADRCQADDWEVTLAAWVAATRSSGTRAAVVASLPELLPEALAEDLLTQGIAPLMGLEDALAAADAAATAGEARAGFSPWPPGRAESSPSVTVGEWDAKQRLRGYGIEVPRGRLCCNPAELEQALAELSLPLAAKASGPALTHKSERGALRLGLAEPDAVRAAYECLRHLGAAVIVEEMIEDGVVELILGLNRDPVVGMHLLVGFGGVLTELLQDCAIVPLPATAQELRQALCGLRGYPLVQGYRGRPAADLEAAVDCALRLQQLAADHGERLVEVDINPLILRPAGLGALAVDALMRVTVAEYAVEQTQ